MAARNQKKQVFTAIDLFAGCGGLSCGLERAGFHVAAGIEVDSLAATTYRLNHLGATVIQDDIRLVDFKALQVSLGIDQLDLLAGCPPCQGFSSVRRKNKKGAKRDPRNSLVKEYLRAVEELLPRTILLENVPALKDYYLFSGFEKRLKQLGYEVKTGVLDASHYGVPQRRKRLVLIGSRIGNPELPKPLQKISTVRDAIGHLPAEVVQNDPMQKIHSHHSERILEMIAAIPKNGGSRKDLPKQYTLDCHKSANIGFSDVYGRMKWDEVSPTITGGCLNPSKGRFLHPIENRSITAREAALIQTFPIAYKFPDDAPKEKIALMIGNALPPVFAERQAAMLIKLLKAYNNNQKHVDKRASNG